MDKLHTTIFIYVRAIWRRKWIAAAVCWAVCAIGWTAVSIIPNQYASEARVYVNVDSLLRPLLRGLAVDTNPLQQLDYMQRTLLSRPNLEQVVHLADLDSTVHSPAEKEQLLAGLAHDITIRLQGQNLFTISYTHHRSTVARDVVQAVLTVFSETTAGNNRLEMTNARRFLDDQIANYETQLRAAEARRAQFREKYAEILPNAENSAGSLESARKASQQLHNELADAIARRDALKKQIADVPQTIAVDQAATVVIANGEAVGSSAARLEDLRRKLVELQTRYTDQHPDVISLKREIASLEAGLAASKGDKGPAPGLHRGTVSNIVYEQLKLRLVDAESAVASLDRRVKDADAEYKRLDKAVKAAPGIELQSQNLDRDYDVLKKNYEELISRRESTNLTAAADTRADRVEFRVVDAPQVALQPIAPNRPILYSGVLLAGLGAGIGAAFLLVQLDRSFASISSLRTLGLPVIGTVSLVEGMDRRRRLLHQAAGLSAVTVVLLSIYGLLMAVSLRVHGGII